LLPVGLRVGYGYPHFYPFPPLRPSSTGHGYSQKSEASQETQAGMEVRHEGRGAGMATSGCAMAAGVAPAGAGGTDEACCRVWRKSLLFYAMKRVLQYLCGGGAKSIAHVAACSGATSVVEAKTSVESYLWRCCMVYGERRRRCTHPKEAVGLDMFRLVVHSGWRCRCPWPLSSRTTRRSAGHPCSGVGRPSL
jgi:hypothetical protein